MTTKLIHIAVPLEWEVPQIMKTLNAEENALILKTGGEMIKEARALVAGLSQKEIYNKIREESKSEIQKLEIDLLVQKELNGAIDKSIRTIYENQLEQMKKQIDELNIQVKKYECQNKDIIKTEVEKEIEKYRFLLDEKEKQVNKINETHEYILKQNQKSTSHKGKEGEEVFEYYADESFRDFKGYSLIDKHTQGGSGDFHMLFEEFDVLVDAKNYKKKVPIDQREKIKKDLIKNEHLTFAWLVSLNTDIDKYDKSPVMYEWINTKQCIVYINNLLENEDPRKLLRVVWFTCKELYKFVEEKTVNNEEINEELHEELQELKDDKFKLMDKIKNMRKIMREINTTLNTTRNMLHQIDDEFKDILVSETEKLVESNYSIFDDWWDTNIELTNDDNKLLSTDLWIKFKQDNKTSLNEFDFTTEKFRKYLKTKVQMSNIILKNKNTNSAFEIKGIKWKYIEKKIDVPEMNVVLVEENPKNKTVKIKKIKQPEVYFDETKDKTIIEDYEVGKDDIITLANKHDVKVFQIVSLLVRYKIITKRSDSRGYDKYKDTEEYKNKIEN
jgi:hypothetical protein